jgi:hypothetical protein
VNPSETTRRSSPSRHLLFAQAREALAAAATRAVLESLPAVARELDQLALGAVDSALQEALRRAAEALEREAIGRAARAGDAVSQRALRCLEVLRRPGQDVGRPASAGDEDAQLRDMAGALVEEAQVRLGEEYEGYAARVRSLVAANWSDDSLNPLGLNLLASAVVSAMLDVAGNDATRLAMRPALCRHLPDALVRAIEATGRVLPSVVPPGTDEIGQVEPPHVPVESVPILSRADAGPQAARSGTVPAPVAPCGLPAPGPVPELRVLEPLGAIDPDAASFAHSRGLMPYTREARSAFFAEARRGLRQGDASPAQLAVLDVVSAMFDYVVDDRRLPEPAKPLIWRLQLPVLELSVIDARYLADEARSLRRLVEHVGAIAIAFADDIVRGSELHRRLDSAVSAIESVTAALRARAGAMARQVDREFSRTAEAVADLVERIARERQALEAAPDRRNRRDYSRRPGPEHERRVTDRVRGLLDERLAGLQIPESVGDFLNGVWLRYLRTAAMRNGEESTEFRIAMQVVDDLIWSLDAGGKRGQRELTERIPPLIRLITQGLKEIGAREEDFAPFFDELFLLHLRRMRRDSLRAGRPDRGPDVPGASAAPPLAESSPGQLQQVPEAEYSLPEVLAGIDLDDLAAGSQRMALAPAEAIARLDRGCWIELDRSDSADGQMKVAWINRRRTLALLVRRHDRRAVSMRIEELSRRFERGEAFLLGKIPEAR